jgi:EmrB/QacA subfamily drug resistance transporter
MPFRFSKDKWLVLSAMICGFSMIFLDSTILPVTLPTIQGELAISDLNLQWIVNIYFLCNASFVILGGKLGDIFGKRNIFMLGLLLFGSSSALGGFAHSALWLMISRGFQGLSAALIAPSVSAIIISTFSPKERGKAIGVSVATSSIFLSMGPFLGGFLTEYISWRWVFFINIFISAIGILLSLKYVPLFSGKKVKIDYLSLVLFIGALLFVTVSAMEGERLGWTSTLNSIFMISGLALALLFYFHYRNTKTNEPFFDFSLFKNINFFIGNLQSFIVQFVLMNSVFWAIFFQDAMGYTPTFAGLWTFLSTAPVLFTAPLAGYLYDKFGVRIPTTIGFCGLIITFLSLILFTFYDNFAFMILSLIVFGFCISQVLTPVASFVISSVPEAKRGFVSGIYNTLRFTGATMGMALLGSIYSGVQIDQMNIYIESKGLSLTKAQKDELTLIYTGVEKKATDGLNVEEIKNESRKGAFKALRMISIISLHLALIGLLLIIAEKVKSNKLRKFI